MKSKEIWKDIPNFESEYKVSNLGKIKSLKYNKEKILKAADNGHGYMFVNLCKQNITSNCYIHRLVAETFIPNPNNLPEVNHKDEDKTNNCVDNLEWCNSKYNSNYGNRNKKMKTHHILKYGKKVNQYDLQGNFIKQFESLSSIEQELGFCSIAISNCCKGKTNTSYNYKWSFENE